MQEKLFKSVNNAILLNETKMFNSVLADKGFQEFILDLNRSQLFEGEDSLGVSLDTIGGGYSFTTEFLTEGKTFTFSPKSKGVKGGSKKKEFLGTPFLLDTGEYYDSYTLTLSNGFFVINSDPQKEKNNLENKYGKNLEGLQDKNLQKIIDVIREKFIQEVRRKIAA